MKLKQHRHGADDNALIEDEIGSVGLLFEQFLYDFGLLIAGHDPPLDMLQAEPAARLRASAYPVIESGAAMMPNFGAVGDSVIAWDPLEATVLFRDHSIRTTVNRRLVPTAPRHLRASVRIDRDAWSISDYALSVVHSVPTVRGAAESASGAVPEEAPEGFTPQQPVNERPEQDWPACSSHGCYAAAIEAGGACLAHTPAMSRATYLARAEGPVDARGVRITADLLEELISSRRARSGTRLHQFDFATFTDPVRFAGFEFQPWETTFEGAVFEGAADFSECTFRGQAIFTLATFRGGAHFVKSKFEGPALFEQVMFESDASFQVARWSASAAFEGAEFHGRVRFDDAFFGTADNSLFTSVYFGAASFAGARFVRPVSLGPMHAEGPVSFAAASFDEARIEIGAPLVSLVDSTFTSTCRLMLRHGAAVVDRADFGGTAVIAGSATEPPELVSIRGADVGKLSVVRANLRTCLFSDALNLDGLTIHNDHAFSRAPRRLATLRHLATSARSRPLRRLFANRGGRGRLILAEEAAYRAAPPRDETQVGGVLRLREKPTRLRRVPFLFPDWASVDPGGRVPDAVWVGAHLTEQALGELYRALRKGREDKRDGPGAADFWFGELEMRRRREVRPAESEKRSWGDLALLTLYWLSCGYAVRPIRLALNFAILVLIAAIMLHSNGFVDHHSFGHALSSSFLSATNLIGGGNHGFSSTGQTIEIVLRILGGISGVLFLASMRGWSRR